MNDEQHPTNERKRMTPVALARDFYSMREALAKLGLKDMMSNRVKLNKHWHGHTHNGRRNERFFKKELIEKLAQDWKL